MYLTFGQWGFCPVGLFPTKFVLGGFVHGIFLFFERLGICPKEFFDFWGVCPWDYILGDFVLGMLSVTPI